MSNTATTVLVVKDGTATYLLDLVSLQDAADHGCPEATHKITGNHGTTYGQFVPSGSGRPSTIRRRGWYSAQGIMGNFHTAPNGHDWSPLVSGWGHGPDTLVSPSDPRLSLTHV